MTAICRSREREGELEALVYGELPAAQVGRVAAHAAGCADCAAELAWLRAERAAMHERAAAEPPLPAAIWDAIEARLPPAPSLPTRARRALASWRREQLRWFGFGMATAAAVAAALLVVSAPERGAPGVASALAPDAAPGVAVAQSDSLAAAERALAEAERAHVAAIDALEGAYREQRHQLDPQVAQRLDREFDETRREIAQARAAAGDDIEARWLLLDAYTAHRRSLQSVVFANEVSR